MADVNSDHPAVTDTPKKRQKKPTKRDEKKAKRLCSHKTGADCQCTSRCFSFINLEERDNLIGHFNALESKDSQDQFLASFVHLKPVARRRPRQDEENANLNCYSYQYKIKYIHEGKPVEQQVCYKAFIALFGITPRRVQTIKAALTTTGCAPVDHRGQHENRPHKLKPEVDDAVIEHIRSFRGRKSHYSLGATRKLYLPEELTVAKMHRLFMTSHPPEMEISYEKYRQIFVTKFNIGFGYPRKDTCSKCDELLSKINHAGLSNAPNLQALMTERELHQRKADTFYRRKSMAKQQSQADATTEAVVFDFQKNLSTPNKSSNDIYYKRQLTFISFNIHVLSTDDVYFYCYDETIGKKGADEVCSMLWHFINNFLSAEVRHLKLFCDGCAGQNKNYTMVRFLHWLVTTKSRFDDIVIHFPIRGHSYLECDRDMALIKQSTDLDLPAQWHQVFREARQKPSPFAVIPCQQALFLGFTAHIKTGYRASCPIPTRPVREFKFEAEHPQLISHRDSWNGSWQTAVIKSRRPQNPTPLEISYMRPIPISQEKYKDLQSLKKLCSPENQDFYSNLPVVGNPGQSSSDEETDDD